MKLLKIDIERRINTINAINEFHSQMPNKSFRSVCFLIYKKARSKRIKLGFKCKSPESFYKSILKTERKYKKKSN